MATDKSEPRIDAILKVAVTALVTLFGVHAALSAYFDRMARAEELRKVGSATPAALLSLRADERERLSSGATPIEKAMHEMALKGRAGSVPEVTPIVSKDLTPLQGWIQMPQAVPGAMTAAPRELSVTAVSDAGASDGAVPKPPRVVQMPRENNTPPVKPPSKAP